MKSTLCLTISTILHFRAFLPVQLLTMTNKLLYLSITAAGLEENCRWNIQTIFLKLLLSTLFLEFGKSLLIEEGCFWSLHSFPTRRSSDLGCFWSLQKHPVKSFTVLQLELVLSAGWDKSTCSQCSFPFSRNSQGKMSVPYIKQNTSLFTLTGMCHVTLCEMV